MSDDIHATYIGTATVLLEIDGLRILTDPAFDPPGSKYWARGFRTITSSKLIGPAIPPEELGDVDLVLLSHEHHFDNLDTLGRIVARRAKRIITTPSGSVHLQENAIGLAAWEAAKVRTPRGAGLEIIATPASHGPWWMRPLLGQVTGFVVRRQNQERGGIYISGDTVLFKGLDAIRERLRPDVGFLHMGAGQFRSTAGIRYSMDAREASEAARRLGLPEFYPIHYDGWTHFAQPVDDAKRFFESPAHSPRAKWLAPGEKTRIQLRA